MIGDLRNKSRENHMLEFEESLTGWILRVTCDSGQVTSDQRNPLPVAFWRNFWERNPSQTLES